MTINEGLGLNNIPEWMRNLVTSGIRSPRVKSLSPGMRLYRFSNSELPPERWPAGPWWFGRKTFNMILKEAVSHPEFGMGWSGRRALAVRQEWSQVDIIVEATVNEKIYVFFGKGEKQYRELAPNGMYITWEGWPEAEQLFLPYINDRSGITALGEQALTIYRSAPVKSYQLF